MASMTEQAREAFLAQTRLGTLSRLDEHGAPVSIPIWYDWDGHSVRMFTIGSSPKMRWLQRDPRVSLLVASELGAAEEWVAFDGRITIKNEGAIELAEQLAARYWDLQDPGRAATLQSWREADGALRLLEFVPTRIRSYTHD